MGFAKSMVESRCRSMFRVRRSRSFQHSKMEGWPRCSCNANQKRNQLLTYQRLIPANFVPIDKYKNARIYVLHNTSFATSTYKNAPRGLVPVDARAMTMAVPSLLWQAVRKCSLISILSRAVVQ